MRVKNPGRWLVMILMPVALWSTVVLGQNPPNQQQGTVFRATTNFVRTDVIVRDQQNRFVPGLKVSDFKVYEDGVLQNVTFFTPWIGGRSLGNLATAGSVAAAAGPARAPEGLVLPTVKPKTDSSGRMFIIFIDDLHIQPSDTPRVKAVLKQVRDLLVHDNDLVGFVSTGTSSIQIDPSYDYGHRRFNEAIDKVMGSNASADDIVEGALNEGSQGPQQLRFNAHTAFRTAYSLLDQLAAVTDRRKAFVYVSSGYDFNPFSDSRLKKIQESYAQPQQDNPENNGGSDQPDEAETLRNDEYHKRTAFSPADLVNEVAQLTRAAQRANVAFYTIDPRGLIAGGMDAGTRTQIGYGDWRDYFQTTISTLKVLADETGGFAGVESNDFERIIRRIDSETSDFYQLGYVSNNPDPKRIRRVIKIEIDRPGLQEPMYRKEYTIPRTRR